MGSHCSNLLNGSYKEGGRRKWRRRRRKKGKMEEKEEKNEEVEAFLMSEVLYLPYHSTERTQGEYPVCASAVPPATTCT